MSIRPHLVLAGALLALMLAASACATNGSRAGESQLTPAPVVTVTETSLPSATETPTTTTEETTVAPTTRTDESHEAELPYEVQVYVSMAKDLVANGTVPSRRTWLGSTGFSSPRPRPSAPWPRSWGTPDEP